MSRDDQKRAVGEAAARRIEPGMTVGLGSGSTAAFFVEALGRRVREGLSLRGGVCTSEATRVHAQALDIPLLDLNDAGRIDLTVDGADELAPGLAIIKGGGAALTREKLVWEASDRCLAVVDGAKLSTRLGRFPLPVEVVAFGHVTTAERLRHAVSRLGGSVQPRLRRRDGEPLVTDNGCLIYDLALEEISDVVELAATLKALTGVVEHGLFPGLADEALVATDGGVRSLMRGDVVDFPQP